LGLLGSQARFAVVHKFISYRIEPEKRCAIILIDKAKRDSKLDSQSKWNALNVEKMRFNQTLIHQRCQYSIQKLVEANHLDKQVCAVDYVQKLVYQFVAHVKQGRALSFFDRPPTIAQLCTRLMPASITSFEPREGGAGADGFPAPD